MLSCCIWAFIDSTQLVQDDIWMREWGCGCELNSCQHPSVKTERLHRWPQIFSNKYPGYYVLTEITGPMETVCLSRTNNHIITRHDTARFQWLVIFLSTKKNTKNWKRAMTQNIAKQNGFLTLKTHCSCKAHIFLTSPFWSHTLSSTYQMTSKY